MAHRLLSSKHHNISKGLLNALGGSQPCIRSCYYSNQSWRRKNLYVEQVLYGHTGDKQPTTVWPDPLGCLGAKDKRFGLPGNIGFDLSVSPKKEELRQEQQQDTQAQLKADKKLVEDEIKFWKNLCDSPTNYQNQIAALKHHEQVEVLHEEELAALEYAADKQHFGNMECIPRSCPDLLRRELKGMFTTVNLTAGPLTVITFAHQTKNDMSSWSPAVEDERERLVDYFVETAKKLCQELRTRSQWADFIDPNSGRPFFGNYTPLTFFETDERYRHLGFRVNDLGCCKVISHHKWGTHTFVGSIFTSAPHDSEYLEQILKNYNGTKQSS